MPLVITGLETAVADNFASIRGANIGLLANQTSVDPHGSHLVDLLRSNGHCKLKKLFAPEHGFGGTFQDMIPVADDTDAAGVQVRSLYGSTADSLMPSPADFEGLDLLLIDLPDIGTRYYTFAQTMAYCMKAAGHAGVKVVVLDRPNPIGGIQIEGSNLKKPFRSFCGIGPIANRHGLTLGELALLFQHGFGNGEGAIDPHGCDLEIVKIEGWNRSQYLDETHVPWVQPSPNMPTLETAILYPGACLFEATNMSEGRGTPEPFRYLGAPYIDPDRWIAATLDSGIPVEGISLSPIEFTPTFQKHAGELCRGIQLRVADRSRLQPYRLGIALLLAAARTFPDHFRWRDKPYEFIDDVPAIDILYGSDTLRRVIEKQDNPQPILQEMEQFESWFASARTPCLLY